MQQCVGQERERLDRLKSATHQLEMIKKEQTAKARGTPVGLFARRRLDLEPSRPLEDVRAKLKSMQSFMPLLFVPSKQAVGCSLITDSARILI